MLIKFSVLKIFLIVLAVETSWVLSTEPKMASTLNIPLKSTSLGSLYRSPRDGFARSSDSSSAALGTGRMSRFFGDYFGRAPAYNYANRYNTNNNYDDRNWYYQPDRYDNRYWYDDRYSNRNDDRYDAYNRPSYDRYDTRYPSTYGGSNYDYRGNGYDNRDPIYYDRDRYNTGDRYDSRTYDRDYDRYPTTSRYNGYSGYYDYKNYRPWDETYRGVSGFDNSGRGYYFANNPRDSYPSRPPSQSPSMGSPYRPSQSQSSYPDDRDHRYNSNSNSNHQAPPRPIQSTSNQANKPNYDSSSSSGSNYSDNSNNNSNNNNNNSSNYDYNKNTNSNDNDRPDRVTSGNQKPSYAGGWDYNESDRNRDSNRPPLNMPLPPPRGQYYPDDRREMEQTGNPYGTRTRPVIGSMGTSYLHDRDSNTPMDEVKSESDAQNTNNKNNEVKGSLIKIENDNEK